MDSIPISVQKVSLLQSIWKHKYLILFIIFTLPLLIQAISEAVKTKNISYPFVLLGEKILNSDHVIYKDIQTLKTSPEILLGVKPSMGIYRNFLYDIHVSWFIWSLLSLIFLITTPFFVIYKIFYLINSSTKLKNIILTIIIGFSFIFIVNLLITIVNLATGNLSLNLSNQNKFIQILEVIYLTIPFHGVVSLIIYLISLLK